MVGTVVIRRAAEYGTQVVKVPDDILMLGGGDDARLPRLRRKDSVARQVVAQWRDKSAATRARAYEVARQWLKLKLRERIREIPAYERLFAQLGFAVSFDELRRSRLYPQPRGRRRRQDSDLDDESTPKLVACVARRDQDAARKLRGGLLRAAFVGDKREILRYPATNTLLDPNGFEFAVDALHLACLGGHLEVAMLLVHRGLRAVPDARGRLPLHHAAAHGRLSVVRWLVQVERAPIDAPDAARLTPLMHASRNGWRDVVKYLVGRRTAAAAAAAAADATKVDVAPPPQSIQKKRKVPDEVWRCRERYHMLLLGDHPNIGGGGLRTLEDLAATEDLYLGSVGVARRRIDAILEDVARGVAHCHHLRIAHLELTADSVFVDERWGARLGNFGGAEVDGDFEADIEGFRALARRARRGARTRFKKDIKITDPELREFVRFSGGVLSIDFKTLVTRFPSLLISTDSKKEDFFLRKLFAPSRPDDRKLLRGNPPPPPPPPQPDAKGLMEVAFELDALGRTDEALEALERAGEVNADALAHAACLTRARGRGDARALVQRALERDPGNPVALWLCDEQQQHEPARLPPPACEDFATYALREASLGAPEGDFVAPKFFTRASQPARAAIPDLPLSLLPASALRTGRILIEGPAGTGKSWLLRELTVEILKKTSLLPLRASLSSSSCGGDDDDDDFNYFWKTKPPRPEKHQAAIDAARREGRLVLLLDGLDEVSEGRRAGIIEATRGAVVTIVTAKPWIRAADRLLKGKGFCVLSCVSSSSPRCPSKGSPPLFNFEYYDLRATAMIEKAVDESSSSSSSSFLILARRKLRGRLRDVLRDAAIKAHLAERRHLVPEDVDPAAWLLARAGALAPLAPLGDHHLAFVSGFQEFFVAEAFPSLLDQNLNDPWWQGPALLAFESGDRARLLAARSDVAAFARRAAAEGFATLVEKLLENGADLSPVDPVTKDSALHCAARYGRVECARALRRVVNDDARNKEFKTPFDLGTSDAVPAPRRAEMVGLFRPPRGRSPAATAAALNRLEELEVILDGRRRGGGASPDATRALRVASSYGFSECAELLVETGAADVDDGALVEAARNGHLDTVRLLLLSLGADPNFGDPLSAACANGHLECARVLLARGAKPPISLFAAKTAACAQLLLSRGVDVDAIVNDAGDTPLIAAARTGRADYARVLIAAGADLGKPPADNSSTPLVVACREGHANCARVLVQAGAKDVDFALLAAAANDRISCVELLLPNAADKKAPLLLAAKHGHIQCLELLLSAGAEASSAALCAACHDGRLQCARLLIDHGADPHSSLFVACQNGHADIARLLLAAAATATETATSISTSTATAKKKGVNEGGKRDLDGATPLAMAAKNGHVDCVRLLLSHGAEVDAATSDTGATPLLAACHTGKFDCAQLLVSAGADVERRTTDDGSTPLLVAAQNGRTDCVRLLLEMGAFANSPRNDGATPLLMAAKNGHLPCVKLLLPVSDVDQPSSKPPLVLASQHGHLETARLLLDHGADALKGVPLVAAAHHGRFECAKLLLERGARADGSRTLLVAVRNGHIDCAKLLLDNGASIDDEHLVAACANGHYNMAAFLLDNGADPKLAANLAATPLYKARHRDIADLLRRYDPRGTISDAAPSTQQQRQQQQQRGSSRSCHFPSCIIACALS
ncbi:hypothetical protein CTAYLR_008984 [Chrysophaeum taylorii]|uniref:AAA+ ATPase domain-containing protein n=1 Tax=Chrysophaeum taylorii TaxID=2483200 RepID=A0AAD7UA26_9STRA|nr:hypothetical protein CTAYLR_008984 [Chrysophaeum taylorii]